MRRDSLFQRNIIDLTSGTTFGSWFCQIGGTLYASQVETGWMDINYLRLALPRLDPAFNGYRLVQISDLHVDQWTSVERLESIVENVNRQHPDLVAITGDFITHNPDMYAGELTDMLRAIKSKDGVYAILGNHDHTSKPQAVHEIIQRSGLQDATNCVYTLKRGTAGLHIAGVDDYMRHKDRLDLVLQQLPETGAAILLAHEPDFADISAPTGRFDLQLSGHSHGGQIRLPFLGTIFLPKDAKKYPSGMYRLGNMILYTNRGLGAVHLHLRYHSRPEIIVFSLHSE